ncbi:MAG: FhaA domain-containing protein [Acidimicrobiia bacterium]|nr:FhaA domain-containing protein [Acidimicrobiia bacterium]
MGLRDLERAIERSVDGVLGRVFRSEVSRLEIAKRVERELEAGTRRGPANTRVMPNEIEVRIHPDDAKSLESEPAEIERDLLSMARSQARDSECSFEGPLVVTLTATPEAQRGTIEVFATAEHSIAGVPPGTLIYPDGYRYDLAPSGPQGIVLGRDVSSDIVIDDERASREHAHVRPTARGWIVEDVGSTNGTRVNGFRMTAQLLVDGDIVTIGATTFTFDAS